MGIRREGKLWRVRVQARGRRISTTARTVEEARELEAAIRRDHHAARVGRAPERTLEAAIVRWLDEEVPRLRSRRATESELVRKISSATAAVKIPSKAVTIINFRFPCPHCGEIIVWQARTDQDET